MTVKDLQYWQQAAANATVHTKAFISGSWHTAQSGETFESINPATGEVIANITSCDTADVNKAVASARAAFNSGAWSNLHPTERGKILVRFSQLIAENADELAVLEVMDMGKPISDATSIDIPACVNTIRWFGEACDKLLDEIAATDPSSLAMITREPIGVVAAVVPWNFPLMMA